MDKEQSPPIADDELWLDTQASALAVRATLAALLGNVAAAMPSGMDFIDDVYADTRKTLDAVVDRDARLWRRASDLMENIFDVAEGHFEAFAGQASSPPGADGGVDPK